MEQITVKTENETDPILAELSFTVEKGEWLAIIGHNGSGKSTLAKVLVGICEIHKGNVTWDKNSRKSFYLILQNPDASMIGETVLEDVCFALENECLPPDETYKRAWSALEWTGLQNLIHTSPDQLSGGQKQMLAIAGAIALQPELLILDEPTAMLDPIARDQVLRIVQRLQQQGTTIIWITQLMDELAYTDRVIALENGQVRFKGTPQQFFYNKVDQTKLTGLLGWESTHCENLGFEPPYAVQVTRCLNDQGVDLYTYPISVEQLAKAVDAQWR